MMVVMSEHHVGVVTKQKGEADWQANCEGLLEGTCIWLQLDVPQNSVNVGGEHFLKQWHHVGFLW